MSRQAVRRTHVKSGDTVEAITGEEAGTGKTGKVLKVMPSEGRAIVEGFNLVKKSVRKSEENPQGGIIDVEAPMALSNLRKVEGGGAKGGKKK